MNGPRTFATRCMTCLFLGTLLGTASLFTTARAEITTSAEATIAVADLERLAHQIEDPQQRDQLLKTLQTLIIVAKHGQGSGPPQEPPNLLANPSQGLFFAFGKLTQELGTIGRQVGYRLATLPSIFAELPAHLRDPQMWRLLTNIVLAAVILAILGIVLQLITNRVEGSLRARANETQLWWRRVWLALITIGVTVTPYIALLIVSGILLSVLPVGPIPAGLAALLIATVLLSRLAHAVASVLLDPKTPNARLLAIDDNTAQRIWGWVVRLIALAAIYFLTTRALLTIGVAAEVYQVVRGMLIILVASVLSVLIRRVAQAHRHAAGIPEDGRPLWASASAMLQKTWPIIAIAYVWCATLLALLNVQHGGSFIVAASLQMAVIIGAEMLLLWTVELLFKHATGLNNWVGRYLPGLETRTLRYLKVLWWGFRVLILMVGLLIILQVWGVEAGWVFTSPFGSEVLLRLITLLVTVAIVMIVMDLSDFISHKLVEPLPGGIEASKKRKTLIPLTATVIKYGALVAGLLIGLDQVGVNITPILAGVGILSLAIGFGAQTLVKDIINGLFILVEDSMAVGDVVNIGGAGGLVEAVNLRTIRLRDLQGSVHIIPNSQVEMITNMTKDFSYYVLDVGVAYREDTDEVIAVLQEIDAEMRADPVFGADMLAPIDILGVDAFLDSAVVVKARLKTRPIKQWSVGREFNRRMKKQFDARGIEIPFPHRTIYWGEPKHGEAPPIQLRIQNLERFVTTGKGDHQTATHHEGNADAQ